MSFAPATQPDEAERATSAWTRPWDGVVSPGLTASLINLSTSRKLSRGQFLYQQGDHDSDLYGVDKGLIKISYLDAHGREAVLGLYGPGTWFGEVPLFDGRPRPANASAVGDTEVRVAPGEAVRALLNANPVWYRDLAQVISGKLRAALLRSEVAALSIPVRVALGLLDLADAYGVSGPGGVLITLRLSQEDLARVLGMARGTCSRGLGVLRRDGLVKITPSGTVLTNIAALATLAGRER